MIIDPKTGKPTASDGPTGREFGVVEICKDGHYSWQVMIPSGAPSLDKLEMAHVLSLLLQSIIQNLRTNVVQEKVKQAMQNAGQILKEK